MIVKWDAARCLQRAVRRWQLKRRPAKARPCKPAVLPLFSIDFSCNAKSLGGLFWSVVLYARI